MAKLEPYDFHNSENADRIGWNVKCINSACFFSCTNGVQNSYHKSVKKKYNTVFLKIIYIFYFNKIN